MFRGICAMVKANASISVEDRYSAYLAQKELHQFIEACWDQSLRSLALRRVMELPYQMTIK